ALNQGRCMIGDEMGLGKTVQAIAAMADRAAEAPGARFLVVCPASVLINWLREVPVHSALVPHRLHGPDREKATARWLAQGGVGVTTFGSLHHVPLPQEQGGGVEMLVVDEAHLVKNPRAQRSRTVAAWSEACWRVLFLTGTPLENRLEEFVALVRLLQPEVVAELPRHLGLAGADAFRARMAPVYLRRNQVDVLVELPELVAVQDWEELGPAGELVYLPAVRAGQFMAMRRAAFATADPRDSTKLERLREIVAEARSNGHRVVVFSYFRDVLATVAQALTDDGAPVHGPITGSVPADQRQALVDAFSVAAPGAALVAQVQAGGVGINVQAASVVVLCEPQLKPTAEAQAIARVHRMGQVRTVQVHRLLVEDSVDERILELLGTKERLFDEYVRDSALAQSAVAAVDVTEARLARDVVAAEQARLGYGPVWDELEGEH
ncbi:MAG: DEAD/DEAH box helicase, partial [Cellulomonadaceae bacterium]